MRGGTGRGDHTAMVTYQHGCTPIESYRSRLECRGAHACDQVDPALLEVERYELEPAARTKIFAAQQKTRAQEGDTPEKRAIM